MLPGKGKGTKRPKLAKKDQNIALLSAYIYYICTMYENSGGPLPLANFFIKRLLE